MGERQRVSRVFIVSHSSLFAEGIRSLLREQPGIKIAGVESDPIKAKEAVRSLRPDAVIVEESETGTAHPLVEKILQEKTAAQVVTLDLSHNFAMVYTRRRVAIREPADLIKAIQASLPREGAARICHAG